MKKFFTMALMSLVFMACNKEENKETPKEEINTKEETQETPKEETHPIEGTWYVESSIAAGKTQVEPADECEKKSNITFSNGKIKIVNYEIKNGECKIDSERTQTYTISGNSIVFTDDEYNEKDNSTFSIDGNTLTINFEHDGTIILKKR